ncbi:MAG TPA: TylF/MycF family methyltransferase [Candidatus Elarobacter sp.]|jgi:O-methyltransferase|nr:TylF/MycF family methyltransferase [Candidatus Elarobacter sp.]
MTCAEDLYLDLMARTLTGMIQGDPNASWWHPPAFDPALREVGGDWPRDAHTMIGMKRLQNIKMCAETVLGDNVPGDFMETGVWRGGAAIFMRAILRAHGVTDRIVWLADSFEGLPPPNPEGYPKDAGDPHHTIGFLAVSLDEVKTNFARYGLLDDQVRFLKGWFRDTLPTAPPERLAVLRLDGDMYESTWDALVNLYDKLSPGGFLIVDDYGAIEACRHAVNDFRRLRNIGEEIHEIDWTGVYWRRAA